MLNEGVRFSLVMVLIEYYNNSKMIVINGCNSSKIFKTTNGTKQGGVISPKFYNIYGAELIKVIKKLNVGVKLKTKKDESKSWQWKWQSTSRDISKKTAIAKRVPIFDEA